MGIDLNDWKWRQGKNRRIKVYAAVCDDCGGSRGYVKKELADKFCRSCSHRKTIIAKQQASLDARGVLGNAADYVWRYPPSGKIAACRLWCSDCGKDRGYCIPQNAGRWCKSCSARRMLLSRNWVGVKHPGWRGGYPTCFSCGTELSNKNSTTRLCRACWLREVKGENSRKRTFVQTFRTHKWYLRWRKQVLVRDQYTCQYTGVTQTTASLVVHHLNKYFQDMVMDAVTYLGSNNVSRISDYLKQLHTLDIGITVEAKYHLTVLHSNILQSRKM